MLKPLKRNKDIVLLSDDKDSSVAILDKSSVVILVKESYKEKINRLTNDGISKGVYVIEENDNTLAGSKSFKNFNYRNFKKHGKYKKMRPTKSQSNRLFATMNMQKFTASSN